MFSKLTTPPRDPVPDTGRAARLHTGTRQPVNWLLLILLTVCPYLHAAISVTDDAGHAVTLTRPAQRIVSLAPHVTELLFAAGAGSVVVGVSEFSDYPDAARNIARVGGGGGIDTEAVLALQPDLVIAWQSGSPAGAVQRLRATGLQVFLSEPRRLEDIPHTIARFAQLAGTELQAREPVLDFNARLADLRARYASRRPVSVFYQIWDHPLMTVNGAHIADDVIRLCSGYNIFSALDVLAPQVSTEAVLVRDPQVIVAAAEHTGSEAELAMWRRWPQLQAVTGNNLHTLRRELLVRHTPRILDGAARLCEYLEQARNQVR